MNVFIFRKIWSLYIVEVMMIDSLVFIFEFQNTWK